MHLMVYAPYGRAGVCMLQECRRLGIGTSSRDLSELASALKSPPAPPALGTCGPVEGFRTAGRAGGHVAEPARPRVLGAASVRVHRGRRPRIQALVPAGPCAAAVRGDGSVATQRPADGPRSTRSDARRGRTVARFDGSTQSNRWSERRPRETRARSSLTATAGGALCYHVAEHPLHPGAAAPGSRGRAPQPGHTHTDLVLPAIDVLESIYSMPSMAAARLPGLSRRCRCTQEWRPELGPRARVLRALVGLRSSRVRCVTGMNASIRTKVANHDQGLDNRRLDNDGTLWSSSRSTSSSPSPSTASRRWRPSTPSGRTKQPFKAVLEGDMKALAAAGEKGLVELIAATHAGMTTDEFEAIVTDWMATARHPRFKRPYTELVYQPMLELLAYLRANGFKTYIVSGGGIEFMRPWTEQVYGIPPEQVVGSSIKTKYEMRDGKPVLCACRRSTSSTTRPASRSASTSSSAAVRSPFGNSDGDFEMLQWTTRPARGARFGLIVHHTAGGA